jgi:hypothetical protein
VRALFLVLLLANILFFAWTRWVVPVPDAGGRVTPSSQNPHAIQLLREAPVAQQGTSGGSSAGSGVDAALAPGEAATCVSGGPYLDRAAAEKAAARLSNLGFTSRIRPSRDEVWVGQWVRIENLATPDDAQNALATLRAAGIADAYLLTEEPPGNVISLGVFSDAARGRQVIALARRAGFTPTADDHYRTEDVFWLDVDRDANAGLPSLEIFGARPGEVPRIELRACPAAESVTPATPAP